MDLEEELIRRRQELKEQETLLMRLKNAAGASTSTQHPNAGPSTSRTELDRSALSNSGLMPSQLSTVGSLATVNIDIPPSKARQSHRHAKPGQSQNCKSFAHVLGDASFSYAEGSIDIAREVDTLKNTSRGDAIDFDSDVSAHSLATKILLCDDEWARHRPVNAIRFHQKHEDVLLSAHGLRTTGTWNAAGVVNVWGLDGGSSRLQRSLCAEASVTSLALPAVSPTTVVGGTLCGDVLTWDLRARASVPVQRAGSFSTDPNFSHSGAPILSLEIASGNTSEFISASTDGTICTWSLSTLDCPSMKFQVRNRALTGTIRVTAIALPGLRKFGGGGRQGKSLPCMFVGAEDGGVYRLDSNDGAWSLGAEIRQHDGPVTGMSAHPVSRKWSNLDDIVISSSMDWTVGLNTLTQGSAAKNVKLYDLGFPGVVCDAAWSPVHPCVFAVGDERGGVALFDAERFSSDARPVRYTLKPTGQDDAIGASVNRVQWSKDGRLLAGGDIEGNIGVWRSSASLVDPHSQEWERMSEFMKIASRDTSSARST